MKLKVFSTALWYFAVCFICMLPQVHAQDFMSDRELGSPLSRSFSFAPPNAPAQYTPTKLEQADNGYIFLNSYKGISIFDGIRWEFVNLPEIGYVNNGAYLDGSYYTAGELDIVRVFHTKDGWQTESLEKILPEEYRQINNITSIISFDGKVYFGTDAYLFEYDSATHTFSVPLTSPLGANGITVNRVNNRLFALSVGKIWIKDIGDEDFKELDLRPEVQKHLQYNALNYPFSSIDYFTKGKYKGDYIIGVYGGAYVRLRGEELYNFNTDIDYFLSSNEVYKLKVLADGTIAIFSNYLNRIIIIDQDGNYQYDIDEPRGLLDNVVLDVNTDSTGGLWVSATKNLIRYQMDTGVTLFGNGNEKLQGDFTKFNGHYYYTTSDGLYKINFRDVDHSSDEKDFEYFSKPSINIQKVAFDGSHITKLYSTKNYLVVMTYTTGIKVIDKDENVYTIYEGVDIETGNVFDPEKDQLLIKPFGKKLEVISLKNKPNGSFTFEAKQLDFNPNYFFYQTNSDPENRLYYLSSKKFGVTLLHFDSNDNIDTVLENNFSEPSELEKTSFIKSEKHKQLLIRSGNHVYKYNPEKTSFGTIPSANEQQYLTTNTQEEYYLKNERIIYSDSSGVWHYKNIAEPTDTLKYFLPSQILNIKQFDETDIAWVISSNYIYRFDFSQKHDIFNKTDYSPVLRKVSSTKNDSIIFTDLATLGKYVNPDAYLFQSKKNSLTFHIGLKNYLQLEKPQFRYKLLPSDANWSKWSTDTEITFQNLWENDYQLLIQTITPLGEVSTISHNRFRIIPPWYRSFYAYLIYFVLLSILVYLITRNRVHSLHKDNRRLEQEVSKRLSEIKETNITLNEVNKSLKATMREKDALMSVVAHDLKAPLARIEGLTNVFNRSKLAKEDNELLDMISNEVSAGMHFIEELLLANRLEEGQREVKMEVVNINTFITNLMVAFKKHALDKAIQLKVNIDLENPILKTDPLLITRMLDNIVSNALKFSEPLTQVVIECKQLDQHKLRYIITDQGPGISEEERTNLFKKFTRLSAKPTGNESSTGLGLYIVKTIVESLNGTIEVESTLGEGTSFIVDIPFERPTADELSHVAITKEDTLKWLDNKNVLIVDDNRVNLKLAQKILERLNLNTFCYHNPIEAVSSASQNNYDLVLMDIQMPEQDGFETVKQLKAKGLSVPYIAFTAETDSLNNDSDVHFDATISKPLKESNFLEAVKSLLS